MRKANNSGPFPIKLGSQATYLLLLVPLLILFYLLALPSDCSNAAHFSDFLFDHMSKTEVDSQRIKAYEALKALQLDTHSQSLDVIAQHEGLKEFLSRLDQVDERIRIEQEAPQKSASPDHYRTRYLFLTSLFIFCGFFFE